MTTFLTPLQRAERTASAQAGALDHGQAIGAGLTDKQLFGLVRSGRWRRPVRGVFVAAGSPDTWHQRTWIAHLATRRAGGVVSHLTAAALWGLLPPSPLPHVTVPPGASAACKAAKVHRSPVPIVDRGRRDGILLTSVSRTIVDLAGMLDGPTFEPVLDIVLCRKLASVDSIGRCLDRAGPRRGKELLRRSVAVWTPAIEPGSVAEVRLLRLCATEGITGLVCQHEVFDDDGGFVARLDVAQPEWRRALEYDGVEAHNPRRWDRDEPRYARLRALGWEVEPVTKVDLLPGERRLRTIADRWTRARAA